MQGEDTEVHSDIIKKYKNMEISDLTERIIGCAMEDHKGLGPG
jgi:hypothetical protein